jgi:hypothetical protein
MSNRRKARFDSMLLKLFAPWWRSKLGGVIRKNKLGCNYGSEIMINLLRQPLVVADFSAYSLMNFENTSRHTRVYRTPPLDTGKLPQTFIAHTSPGFFGKWCFSSTSTDLLGCLVLRQMSQHPINLLSFLPRSLM